MRHTDIQFSRLGDNRGIRTILFYDRACANAGKLFVRDSGEDHVSSQVQSLCSCGCDHDGGQPTLHIVGASSVKAVAFDDGFMGSLHVCYSNGICMGIEHERTTATRATYDTNDVGPSRRWLVQFDFQARAFKPAGHKACYFTLARSISCEIGIDGIDGDELPQKVSGLMYITHTTHFLFDCPAPFTFCENTAIVGRLLAR